jgi:hypothetical protein
MSHEFSKLRFDENNKPVFDYIALTEQCCEDVLQYDQIDLDLVVDRVPKVTKRFVSHRDTYTLMEINAMIRMTETEVNIIDGIKIIEKPEINL